MRSKPIILFILILLVAACTPQRAPLATAISQATVTLPPTNTPYPTPTIKPTATEDPLAGAPEGTTDVKNGEWIKKVIAENGKSFDYAWNSEWSMWVRPLTPDKIPFWDEFGHWQAENGEQKPFQDISNIMMYAASDVLGGDTITAITHKEIIFQDNFQYPPYLSVVNGKFLQNYFHPKCCASHSYTAEELRPFWEGLQNGTIEYPFKIGSEEYIWYPSPDHGAIIYVFPYDEVNMTKDNSYHEWIDIPPKKNEFLSKFIRIDEQGNMVWVIISKLPLNELEDWEITTMLLYPVAAVLDSVNSDAGQRGDSPFLQTLVDKSNDSDPPYIEIQR